MDLQNVYPLCFLYSGQYITFIPNVLCVQNFGKNLPTMKGTYRTSIPCNRMELFPLKNTSVVKSRRIIWTVKKRKIMQTVLSISKLKDVLEIMQMVNVRLDHFNSKFSDKLEGSKDTSVCH